MHAILIDKIENVEADSLRMERLGVTFTSSKLLYDRS